MMRTRRFPYPMIIFALCSAMSGSVGVARTPETCYNIPVSIWFWCEYVLFDPKLLYVYLSIDTGRTVHLRDLITKTWHQSNCSSLCVCFFLIDEQVLVVHTSNPESCIWFAINFVGFFKQFVLVNSGVLCQKQASRAGTIITSHRLGQCIKDGSER